MGKNFITKHSEMSIEGLPITSAFELGGSINTLKKYCSDIVMSMDVDARDFVLNIIPFMLRTNFEVVYVDTRNRGSQEMQH